MAIDPTTAQELKLNIATVILAGGQGTRLFPLTKTRCKPAVAFGGIYRLIDIPISNSLNAHIHHIFVISQYLANSLNQHILETYQMDLFRTATIQLLSPEETPDRKNWFKGTADAIRQNIEYLEACPYDHFLILSGDQLYNMNFVDMLSFAKREDADLVIAALPVEEREAKRMGLLKIQNDCQVLSFVEKPSEKEILRQFELPAQFLKGHHIRHPEEKHYLGSMGIYIFKRKALFSLLKEKGDDFGKELIPIQVARRKTSAYLYKGYWEDIGTVASYYEANMALTYQSNCLNLHDENNPIFTHPHHLPSPIIKESTVTHSYIGQGSVIEAKEITHSIVGIRSHIKRGTIIRNSILMGNLFYSPAPHLTPPLPEKFNVGEDCLIEKAIIDEHTSIGNHVQLINKENRQSYDGNGIYIRDGIIIVTSGTQLPDGFIL